MAAMVSMKQPTTTSRRFTRIRITIGLPVMPRSRSANCSVTRLLVRIQAKIEAAATIRRMMEVVSMVSMLTFSIRRQVRVR